MATIHATIARLLKRTPDAPDTAPIAADVQAARLALNADIAVLNQRAAALAEAIAAAWGTNEASTLAADAAAVSAQLNAAKNLAAQLDAEAQAAQFRAALASTAAKLKQAAEARQAAAEARAIRDAHLKQADEASAEANYHSLRYREVMQNVTDGRIMTDFGLPFDAGFLRQVARMRMDAGESTPEQYQSELRNIDISVASQQAGG